MPSFEYKASRRDGASVTGQLTAATRDDAIRQLRKSGLTPMKVQGVSDTPLAEQSGDKAARKRERKGGRQRRGKAGAAEVLSFTSELAVLLRAGLPLDRALKVLMGVNGNPAMHAVISDLLESVKGGKGFSQALSAHQNLFGDFYINMVRSGELGGHLAPVLADLTEHLESVKALRGSVVSSLIYPAILVVVALLSVVLMLGFVVPQFEALFEDMGEALPWPTQAVIAMGDFMSSKGWVLIAIFVALVFLYKRALRGSPRLRKWRDRSLLRVPLFGELVLKYETTQFARTAGTLLTNGVSVLDALRISMATVGNSHIRGAMSEMIPSIKGGVSMALILERTGVFSPVAVQMIRVGEESGRLEAMLLELARVYDDEVRSLIKRALTLLEPLIILVLGVMIAAIIISILMGILSVNELAV